MAHIFLSIINMSISAGYIVLAVLLLRLLLKKSPKWISVILWGIVAVRLVCPFSIESVLSLIPSAETISQDIMTEQVPTINTGISVINSAINPVVRESFSPAPGDSANPLQIWVPVMAAVWIVGVAVMLIYTVISYGRVRRSVETAILLRDNIYQSENVVSPFVLGVINPKIYLPFDVDIKNIEHIVAHEVAHIHRKDHLWKPIGFLLLALHWFNPLMWLGYVMLCRDIELACDERVIKELDLDARADYFEALLSCSVNRRMIAACPLAFGEVGVKDRVKSVLNYKKPAFWVIIVAVVVCMVVAVCFLTDPPRSTFGETNPNKLSAEQISLMEEYPEFFGIDSSNGLDIYVWQMAPESYWFSLFPHDAAHPVFSLSSVKLVHLKGVNVMEMRAILATYDVNEKDIHIVPCQNPISSYIGDWQIVEEGKSAEDKINAYVARVREMLFGEYQYGGEENNGAPTGEADGNADSKESEKMTLIYNAPMLSWVGSFVERIRIEDGKLYNDDNDNLIAPVTKIPMTDVFDSLRNEPGGRYSLLADELQQNNAILYEVDSDTSSGVGFYYVMVQKDGSILLVYGHYENGDKNGFIRWIYDMGDNAVHVPQ